MRTRNAAPTWRPAQGISNFDFGDRIAPHGNSGAVRFRGTPRQHGEPRQAVKAWFCDDLQCEVITVRGNIHKIYCDRLCWLDGYNLVGTEERRLIELLRNTGASLGFEKHDGFRVIQASGLGFSCTVTDGLDLVSSVFLEGTGDDHVRRERAMLKWAAAFERSLGLGSYANVVTLPRRRAPAGSGRLAGPGGLNAENILHFPPRPGD